MTTSDRHSPHLDRVQRWMQTVITHPLGVAAGVASPEAGEHISVSQETVGEIIPRSRALTSIQRLEVYANAYYARLLDCMRDMFPALVYALGQDLFNEFSFGYLQKYPSQSYTLGRLANNFVRYLEETRPDVIPSAESETLAQRAADWPDFFIDLARLEWTIDQVFDGPGFENRKLLQPDDLSDVSPERWPQARLTTVTCLHLLSFRFPVNDYYSAFRQQQNPATPTPGNSFLAVYRRQFIVRRLALSSQQYELLVALASGKTVGQAIEMAAAGADRLDELADLLQKWFRTWTAAGFFERIEVPT